METALRGHLRLGCGSGVVLRQGSLSCWETEAREKSRGVAAVPAAGQEAEQCTGLFSGLQPNRWCDTLAWEGHTTASDADR